MYLASPTMTPVANLPAGGHHPSSPPLIHLVEENAASRELLQRALEEWGYLIRGYGSPTGFQRAYRPEQTGCVLLDLGVSPRHALASVMGLLEEKRRPPIICVAARPEVETVVAVMKAGALDFLPRPLDAARLEDAIRRAFRLDQERRRRDLEFRELDARVRTLNARDQETLQLLLDGLPNKVMATRLSITQRAVEMRRASIMRKLDVDSLAELFELVLTHRFLAPAAAAEECRGTRFASGAARFDPSRPQPRTA